MSDVLKQFVTESIWCTPGQDQQLCIKPKKVHVNDAPVFGRLPFMDRNIDLPNKTNAWFVYQIGTFYQKEDQLPIYQHLWEEEAWRSLTEPLIGENLITTLFTAKGITFPLFRSYYMYTKEKALLIAVEHISQIPANLGTEDLYVRFYRNAFYDSERSESDDFSLQTGGVELETRAQINAINLQLNNLSGTKGGYTLTINGQRYRNPGISLVSVGDIVEWIYDPTIIFQQRTPLTSLPTFGSTLDSGTKRVFHPNVSPELGTIHFRDDLEVSVFTLVDDNVYYGACFPVVDESSIRQLTDQDHALKATILTTVGNSISQLNPSVTPTALIVEVQYRRSGYQRTLQPNSSYLTDLYKLSGDDILAALSTAPGSNFDKFFGRNLETSPYIQAMNAEDRDAVTETLAEAAIGYYGLTLIKGTIPTRVTNNMGVRTLPIPEHYQDSCTGYEYNITGQYLTNRYSTGEDTYTGVHPSVNMVELIKGQGTPNTSAYYGTSDLPFNPLHSHRVYACDIVSGTPTYVWTDITTTNQYTVDLDNNLINFTNPADPRFMMVRTDERFTVGTPSAVFGTHFMRITLVENVDRADGSGLQIIPMEVPGNELTLFMNSRSLINGIDYFVDFPHVYIANRDFLNQPVQTATQIFHWRSTGLGNGTMAFTPSLDRGIVKHGLIGIGKYVLKNDKPLRIVSDGYLRLQSTVRFSQDYPDVLDPSNILNGKTYQVQAYPTPIQMFLVGNEETMRAEAEAQQIKLKAYMNARYVPPSRDSDAVVGIHYLVCPFHAKILDDLIADVFTSGQLNPANDDSQLLSDIAPYLPLFDFSPCKTTYGLVGDPNYTLVPHARTLPVVLGNADKFTFLNRVSQLVAPSAMNVGSSVLP